MSRTGLLIKLGWQLLRLRFSSIGNKKQQTNRLLFDNFKHLGGVYVKFLQILALNVEFLKGWAGPAEFEIFEAVAFEEIDLPALLRTEIPDYEQHFTYIEPAPFAAGSFAQVYRGQLRDGSDVVLKILRPSLVKNLASDLRLLGRIARFTGWLYKGGVVDIGEVYRQFATTVRDETDYQREVKNAGWFYVYFAHNADVVIPRTYADLSGSHIIVQELIGGLSLAEVFQAHSSGQESAQFVSHQLGSDLWAQMEILGTELLVATVTADYIIGDPHPGNIKLLPDNKIGIIDFGIAAPAPANRHAFLNLMREYEKLYAQSFDAGTFTLAALQFFDEELVGALGVAGQLLTPLEPYALLRKIGESARQTLADAQTNPQTHSLLDQKAMMRLFNQSINEQNRFGIIMNLDAAAMLKSATTLLKMVGSISDDGQNFVAIHRALQRAIAIADNSNIPAAQTKPSPRPEHALEVLSSWLTRLADSDPFLYRQITATIR
jgi:hypothetical protein